MKLQLAATISIILSIAIAALANILSLSSAANNENWSPFECGFTSITPQRIPFSMQFFIVGVLFLIFDIEISMLFPIPSSTTSTTQMATIIVFLLILWAGLLYEWNSTKLQWNNWM